MLHPGFPARLSSAFPIDLSYIVFCCFVRWWRAEVDRSAVRAAAEAQQRALEQSATVSLQARVRGRLARAALHRETQAVVAVQARYRGISGRTIAADRKTAVVRVQAFVRGAAVAAWYRKTRDTVTALQARRRGIAMRARLAAEADARAAGMRAATEEIAAVTLQAFARAVLERVEQRRNEAAAAVVQGAWRRRQTRVEDAGRVREVACAAVAVQRGWRRVAAEAKGRRARYGVQTKNRELWRVLRSWLLLVSTPRG